MSKLFIGCVAFAFPFYRRYLLTQHRSGLAWHTDDQTLRAKFEEYGQVDEAVHYTPRYTLHDEHTADSLLDRRQGSRHWPQPWFRFRSIHRRGWC
jgi:hypothetical protein